MSEANLLGLVRSPIRDRFGLVRLTDAINASLEKHFWQWASLFAILFLSCSIARALRIKLWSDELFTIYVAKLASPEEIIKLNDASPPLYPIIAHWLLPLVGNDALAVRLPATLGYCGMILCLLAFCRRRLPAAFAFGASLLACERALFYATEGRAYGLILGCAAGALLCWQIAAQGHRRGWAITLLASLLALMVALHYYSIFFLVPLFVAEVVRWQAVRRVDFGVWAAMVPAPLVLGLHYVLLAANQDFQAHFWAEASLDDIAPFYARFMLPPLMLCGLAFCAALLPGLSAHESRDMQRANLPSHEWTAVVGLALMPAVVIVVSMHTTHIFHERYILWTMMGFALLGATILSAGVWGRPVAGVALVGLAVAAIGRLEIHPLLETPVLLEGEGVRQELEKVARDRSEPIVVAKAHIFNELSYYLNSPLRERLVYAASRELDVQYLGSDSDAIILAALGQRGQLPVKAYDEVLTENRRFLLAATSSDYLPQHLIAAGYRVAPLRGATMVYEVQAPNE